MPVKLGSSALGNVKFGASQLASIYQGADEVWTNVLTLTLNSAQTVNLRTFIDSQGSFAGKKLIVNIPDGEVIGSTDPATFALVTGDLSPFTYVHVNNYGEIQGAGGAAPGGAGGGAFKCDSGVGTEFKLNNMSGAAVRAGGGAGGNGGVGGQGSDVSWFVGCHVTYNGSAHDDGWGTSPNQSVWAGGILYNEASGNPGYSYWHTGGPSGADIWQRCGFESGHWYETRWGNHSWGSGGSGGAGGRGQGYTQSRVTGLSGSSGSNRSGSGGYGGSGGLWGSDGSAGNNGNTGYYYSNYSSGATNGGSSGGAKGATNYAILGNSYMTFNDNGTVQGWTGS